MRLNILTKLIFILLFLTILPLSVLGYLAVKDAKSLGLEAAGDAEAMGLSAIADSTEAMNELGEQLIRMQAELTADRVSTYIAENPEMTSEELQNDPEFIAMATQKVGDTGYLNVSKWTEETGGIFAVHPMSSLIGLPSRVVLKDFPELMAIIDKAEETREGSGGYYKWKEEDGTIRDKYIWITSREDSLTADGFQMNVSATTYIDEFSKPSKAIEAKIKSSLDETVGVIKMKTEGLNTQNTIFVITAITILIVLIIGFVFARALTNPIKALTDVGNKLAAGDLDVEIPEIKSKDEIKDLAESLKSALAAIAFLIDESKSKK